MTDIFQIDPGGLAQLGERLHGMQEVSGSSPLSSTIVAKRGPHGRAFFVRKEDCEEYPIV
jgi:hypothetical protein